MHIISAILKQKEKEIDCLKKNISQLESSLSSNASKSSNSPKSHRNKTFREALERKDKDRLRVIAECKKLSPSMSLLRSNYNIEDLTQTYKKCGADALSILTDQKFFGGSMNDIHLAKTSGLNILRKDFILSPLQIEESFLYGAHAILLIVRILTPKLLLELYEKAKSLALDVLVEVHNQKEAEIAIDIGADIIGINHRDLDTLKIDLKISKEIAPLIRKKRENIIIVAESGIHNKETRQELELFADAVLMGTTFMKSADISAKWKSIFEN